MNDYHVIVGAFVACDGSEVDDAEREEVMEKLEKLQHWAPSDGMGEGDMFVPEEPLCRAFDPRDDPNVGETFTSDDVRRALEQLVEQCADEIAILRKVYGRDEVTIRWGYFVSVC